MKRKQKLWPATGKSKGGLDWSELSHPIYSIYNERRLLGARWLYSFQVASPSPQDSRRFLAFSLFIMNWIMGFMFYFYPLYLFYFQVWFGLPCLRVNHRMLSPFHVLSWSGFSWFGVLLVSTYSGYLFVLLLYLQALVLSQCPGFHLNFILLSWIVLNSQSKMGWIIFFLKKIVRKFQTVIDRGLYSVSSICVVLESRKSWPYWYLISSLSFPVLFFC